MTFIRPIFCALSPSLLVSFSETGCGRRTVCDAERSRLMLYPYMTLDDNTQIVHSERLSDGQVRVCVEQPIHRGFNSATCMLPSYTWQEVEGFSAEDLDRLQRIIL